MQNLNNPYNNKAEQGKSYVLLYEMPQSSSFDPNYINNSLKQQSKYVTFQFYQSSFKLKTSDDLKNIIPSTEYDYYYLYIVFEERQKIYVEKTLNTVLNPKYYHYKNTETDYIVPLLLEKNPNQQNNNSVLYILNFYLTENKARLLLTAQNETKKLSTTNLEYHYWQILKLDSLNSFFDYVESNNLHYYLDNLISKYKALQSFNHIFENVLNKESYNEIPSFLKAFINNDFKAKNTFQNFSPEQLNLKVFNEDEDLLFDKETEVKRLLDSSNYKDDPELAKLIFSNSCIYFSKVLNDIAENKNMILGPNPSKEDLKKLPPGYKLIMYKKKLITLPYRKGNPNVASLGVIYEFLSDSLKDDFKNYVKQT